MPRLKLTEKGISRLAAPDVSGRQTIYWDTQMHGFGVLVSGKSDAKTFVAQRRLPDGTHRRVTIGSASLLSLDKAKDDAKGRLVDLLRGIDQRAEQRKRRRAEATMQQVLEAYLDARKDLRAKSRKDYRLTVERYLTPWLDIPIRSISGEMVEVRHREIKSEIERRQRYNGEAAANGAMRVFRLLWNFAGERDPDMPANPVRLLKRQWYPAVRRDRIVRSDQLPTFYRAVDQLPNRASRDYLLLLLFTGFRRGEAACLQWTDIDFEQRVVRLPGKRTKNGRKLDLPMTNYVYDLLQSRRAVGREGQFVFAASSKSGHIEEAKFPLAQVAETTGISISPHDLRRTFVTVAESCDISPLALKALVNHSLGNDVTSGYIISTIERLRGPAQRVCDRLKALCQVPDDLIGNTQV